MEVLGQFGWFWARFWGLSQGLGFKSRFGWKVGSAASELFPPVKSAD